MSLEYLAQSGGWWLLVVLAGYLLGSIPTAYLFCKLKGIDIRTVGSGNVGATNAARVLGKAWGVVILLLDALKGFLPVFTLLWWFSPLPENPIILAMSCGLAAILGHMFPVWLSFQGGKGVATGLGVMLALVPQLTALAAVVFVVTVALTRYVSLGSILAAISLLIFFLLFYSIKADFVLFIYLVLVVAFVVYKHRTNIQRLLNGTESKLGSRVEVKK